MRKKISAFILLCVICLPMVMIPAAAATPVFSDVPQTHWAYAYIMRAYEDDVMTGTYHNAATGERQFSPDATLTMPELITIVTRAFYGDEVEASTATGEWYAKNEEVANAHDLLGFGVSMSGPATRYAMAVVMRNVMVDKGAKMPTEAELETVQSRIADWNSIPAMFKDAVATVFYLNIITGVDSNGTFDGSSTMNRATAATVYCRLADAIANLPVEPDEPTPTPSSDPVGTISDEEVTLSLETHAPVVDYWSDLPEDVKELCNQDAYNALCQTIADTELITSGELVRGVNKYYNYAVYSRDTSDVKNMNVNGVCSLLNNCGVRYNAQSVGVRYNSQSVPNDGLIFFTASPFDSELTAVLDPIVAGIPAGASDREIVEYCVQEVIDRFDYEVSGGFNWLNGKTTGDCDDYSMALKQLLSEAGIPSFETGGEVTGGSHVWLRVYIRNGNGGNWYIVDGPAAEVGYSKIMTFAEHEKLYGYDHSLNDSDLSKIAMSIVETFWG